MTSEWRVAPRSRIDSDDRFVAVRSGMTLVELLVVVTILVILVSVTIPVMRSIRNGSQLEAAVRKIESVMNTAKTMAITNGRPAGVVFVRDEATPSVAYEVALVESPPPYGGETPGKKVLTVYPDTMIGGIAYPSFQMSGIRPLRTNSLDPTTWFVRPGDQIRFDFKGDLFTIRSISVASIIALEEEPLFLANRVLGQKILVDPQFYRSPRRTMASPIELPQGAYVKLSNSGITLDRGGATLDQRRRLFSQGDIMLTFDPSGNVSRLYRGWPSDAEDTTFGLSLPVSSTLRIDLGDGSPAAPANAQRFLITNRADRNSKPIAPTALIPPLEGS